MTDSLLTSQDIEERLSVTYVRAVAARAGYTTSERDLDRDGVDMQIQAGGAMRPAIDLQLKATINLGIAKEDGCFRFKLARSNYDKLIDASVIPRLLVVLDLPKERAKWLNVTKEGLILRRRAYWLSIRDLPRISNKNSITLSIPERNVLDVERLQDLMEESRTGKIA